MRCEVLLFAQLAEAVGTFRLTIELPGGVTAGEALQELSNKHEAIATLRDTLAIAVNEQYCTETTVLGDGDTLALIPPVSGG